MSASKMANNLIGSTPKGGKACDGNWFNTKARETTGKSATNDKKQMISAQSPPEGKLQGHAR